MQRVILLNADFSFLNVLGWKRAFTLIAKGKVEVLKYGDKVIHNAKGVILKIPLIMRLIKLIRTVYRTKVPFSKKNVMVRDSFKCVYCGVTGVRFTIDHVKPKSKGGKSSFENCVTACKICNNKKGDRTCPEVRMYPKTNLIAPTISEFLRMKIKTLGIQSTLDDLFANM
jgi:5-methylcytosine-specific restriction endonuclease McrA